MLSFFLCRDLREHRRVKPPCYLGSRADRHRQPTLVPARHHQCNDCSPRDNNGCKGRRLASASEENSQRCQNSCPHYHVQRTCTASNSRTNKPLSCSMRSDCFCHQSPHSPLSISTLCYLLWLTGQLVSKRSKLTPPTFC